MEKKEKVNLLYREGYLPTHHDVSIDGIKVMLSYGSSVIKTPFKIKLNDFQLERYPGSSSPSSYAIEVTVIDDKNTFDYKIFMNNVLDYKGYRFFQASYDTDEKGTVLSGSKDRIGTLVTYLGYFLMSLGMLLTFFGKSSRFQIVNKKLKGLKQKEKLLIFCLFFSCLIFSQKQPNKLIVDQNLIKSQYIDEHQADLFGRLLVQDVDGCIKPINTIASEFLRKLSRKSNFQYSKKDGKIIYNVNQTFLAMHIAPNIWENIPIIKVDFKKVGSIFKNIKIGENGLISFKIY